MLDDNRKKRLNKQSSVQLRSVVLANVRHRRSNCERVKHKIEKEKEKELIF